MDTFGRHLVMDIWLEEEITPALVESILSEIRARFSVVQEIGHEFSPYGLTHVCILSESHFSMHTYPEHRYLSLDLYICSQTADLAEFQSRVLGKLKILDAKVALHPRGVPTRSELVLGQTAAKEILNCS